MDLPNDLPGGWEFLAPYVPTELEAGQVWRKCGPIDALKIVRVMLPGNKEHDGGAPGISVRPSVIGRKGVKWSSTTWFKLGSHDQLQAWLKEHGYALAHT